MICSQAPSVTVGQSKSHLPRQGRLARLPRGRLVASPQDIGDHSKIEPGSPWALVLAFSEAAAEEYKSFKKAPRLGSTRPIESRTSVRAMKKLGSIWVGSCVFCLARKADKGVYSLARFCCGSAQRVVGTRREVDHKQGTHATFRLTKKTRLAFSDMDPSHGLAQARGLVSPQLFVCS